MPSVLHTFHRNFLILKFHLYTEVIKLVPPKLIVNGLCPNGGWGFGWVGGGWGGVRGGCVGKQGKA